MATNTDTKADPVKVLRSLLQLACYNCQPAIREEIHRKLREAGAEAYPAACLNPVDCAFRGYCPRDLSCDD